MKHYLLTILFFYGMSATAQESNDPAFFEPSPELNKSRFWGLNGSIAAGYGGTMLLLNEYWYKGYEKSSFHFFDDSREWLQMDKAGHIFSAYLLTSWGSGLYKWAGLEDKQAAWAGGIAGSVLMTTIEVLDGFSAKWGASLPDLAANTAGAGLFIGQELLWQEQRMRIKLSAYPQTYQDDIRSRAHQLYGTSVAEWALKDYNAHTLWLSASPTDFFGHSAWWPQWVNIAAGYGANGMFGGFQNKWCATPGTDPDLCPPQDLIDRSDIPRYRQYYLSLDVDLTKIKTGSPFLKTVLHMVNVIKIPAPALEYNGQAGVKWHWVMF